ncbi:gas vesicle protein GvpN [Candidatus Cyanaurora vandensis]|uniref:gas vesicle protein GvpN n=2 Tax=Candidatus Cyanaurora vandensis TaxID=2714958 RepID=UPI00257D0E31|nr:gas vesicle protein GvpN [Candidatus Cyanaurora vandensis]
MTTVLQLSSKQFVTTPYIESLVERALRFLHCGYSIHLRGPAGTGKTTLALHLASLVGRPVMLLYGDDEFKSSDLVGNQAGYKRRQVVDNYIHSVMKMEDDLQQNWVDSRLTTACREGLTLVYDEFNRSRPEVNNVLLGALEEGLIVLPPRGDRPDYVRVHPQFRAIFTSNPEEYCGVHQAQNALIDRMVTLDLGEPDVETEVMILSSRANLPEYSARLLVEILREFRTAVAMDQAQSIRASLMIGQVCRQHEVPVHPSNPQFIEICLDVLLSRSKAEREVTLAAFEKVLAHHLIFYPREAG